MKYLCFLFIITLSITTNGQNIIGQWETYDDNTKEKKAVIEVYLTNNLYFAKIVKSFIGEKNDICETCKGAKKNRLCRKYCDYHLYLLRGNFNNYKLNLL